jgi:hypothetical protein
MFIAAATLAAFAAAWLWSVAVATFLFRARGRALLTPAYRRLLREDPGLQVRKYGSPFFYVPMALAIVFLLSALASWVTR